jgi:hypothetical protein
MRAMRRPAAAKHISTPTPRPAHPHPTPFRPPNAILTAQGAFLSVERGAFLSVERGAGRPRARGGAPNRVAAARLTLRDELDEVWGEVLGVRRGEPYPHLGGRAADGVHQPREVGAPCPGVSILNIS